MKKTATFLIISLSFSVTQSLGQTFFGQEEPGLSPEVFASAFISTKLKQRDIAVSPDETEIYYTIFRTGFDGNIYYVKLEDNEWSTPEIASFSGNNKDLEPTFSPDGSKLFFSSKRNSGNYDIWFVEREDDGTWSAPESVGSPVNTSANEFFPSVTNNGSLYYTAEYANGVGGEDIWRSQYLDGEYQSPEVLSGFCGTTDEFNAYVAPNESYIYFSSFGRADGFGGGDLYLSRKSGNDWGAATNLGSIVNSARLDYCPFVSGGILFFTSERGVNSSQESANPFDLGAVVNSLLTPGFGSSDIFWVKR